MIQSGITVQGVVRLAVGLHLVALLVFPKHAFGLITLRPEDLTGVLLIGLVAAVALSGFLIVPRGSVWIVGMSYMAYFWLILLARDAAQGRYEPIVLWAKEVSYLAFGYLVWLGYRTNPGKFLRLALVATLPAVSYGLIQVLTRARGIYGVSPWGHESSPASSGMIYFACAIIVWMGGFSGRFATPRRALFGTCLLLLVATGSKVSVLGAISFFGTHLAMDVWRQGSRARVYRFVLFAAGAVVLLVGSVTLARLGLAPNGLARYTGFMSPFTVLANRGIWWKLDWIAGPVDAIIGAGYSVAHLPGGTFSYGMAMDNQILYYLVTGGIIGLCAYVVLCTAVFRARPADTKAGRVLRALVVSYAFMGLGGEVLQLSVFGNVFWMVVGLCLCDLTARPLAGTPTRSA